MEKLWWMKKNEPAQDYEDDVNGYYESDATGNENAEENGYDGYEGGDISDVQVAISGDPITEAAKVEPLMKKSFSVSLSYLKKMNFSVSLKRLMKKKIISHFSLIMKKLNA